MARISGFMIGVVVVSLVITLFGIFLGGLNENYVNSNYDASSIEAYNKLEDINAQSKTIKSEVSGIKDNPNALDVIGSFFTSGYQALKLTLTSFDTFDTMVNAAATDADLGQVGQYLKIALMSIVIILIFVGVVISAILKKDV